jgi:superfamily II DNA or RNA helicase
MGGPAPASSAPSFAEDAGTGDGSEVGEDTGFVALLGTVLMVTMPTAMSETHARRVADRLTVFAEGAPKSGTTPLTVMVPAARAHRLADELQHAWPAVRWNWSWSAAATAASTDAGAAERELFTALDTHATEADAEHLLASSESVGFTRVLLPGQARAVAQLLKARGGSNFSVPGAGKTTMTYALYAHLRAQGVVDRMLVVAPLSAHEAWREEAEECFSSASRPVVAIGPPSWSRRAEVVVQNYERAARPAAGARARAWAAGHRVMVVFDEAHRAKRGEEGLHGRAARDLAGIGVCRLVLTGTPMPNSEEDLAAVLDLAWPGSGERLARGDLAGRAPRTWVRLTKADLGLVPVELTVERLRLDPVHRKIYDLVATQDRALADAGLLEGRPDLANRAVMRLLAVASNPALLDGREPRLQWPADVETVLDAPLTSERDLQHLLDQCRPVKLLRAVEAAAEMHRRGEKLLIWTTFVGNVAELARLLEPYGCATVTGAMPVDDPRAGTDRVRELARFRGDETCTVLVATPQTLGEGVSLHRAAQAQLHVDRGYNAGLYLQALDRTHRVGMPPGTTARATVLVGRDTIDESVERSLRVKIAAMREVLDDPSLSPLSLPEEGDVDVDVPNAVQLLLGHLRLPRD